MNYERTPDGQIHADFARRIGLLMDQYEACSMDLPPEERYDATFLLTMLQALLTICSELLKRNSTKRELPAFKEAVGRSLDEDPTLLGFQRSSVIEQWPSDRSLIYRELLECLRNAMSHPCAQSSDGLPQTGYTSWQSDSGVIEGFTFTQSPWVNSGGRERYMPKIGDEMNITKLEADVERFSKNHRIPDLLVREDGAGHMRVFHQDTPFVPVLRIKLNIPQLRMLTRSLSEFLSAPLDAVKQKAVMSS